jgi:hypothetical protein
MSEWSYVTAAYAVTWIVLIGYAIRLEMGVGRRAKERFRAAVGQRGL